MISNKWITFSKLPKSGIISAIRSNRMAKDKIEGIIDTNKKLACLMRFTIENLMERFDQLLRIGKIATKPSTSLIHAPIRLNQTLRWHLEFIN